MTKEDVEEVIFWYLVIFTSVLSIGSSIFLIVSMIASA